MDKFKIIVGLVITLLLSAFGYVATTNNYAHFKLLDMIRGIERTNCEQAQEISKLGAIFEYVLKKDIEEDEGECE